jgi:ribose transport system ATP-binding protein
MTASAASSTAGDLVLEGSGISKAFPGVKALNDVQIQVRRGRLNALLGENGAGKSTLMSILAGVFPADAGTVTLRGRPVSFRNTREAQEAGVSIIFQELNLIPQLSVAENIFLGREPRSRVGLINYDQMNREADALMDQLETPMDARAPVERLSVGQQQVVEIAKALSFRADVLIMDEPTSAITEQEVAVLFRLIRQLKRRGVGIIYITHKLDELEGIADDVTVLRDGHFVGTTLYADVNRNDLIRMMVGRDLSDLFTKTSAPVGEAALEAQSISLRHPERSGDFLVNEVSFQAKRGEVLGVFGLMGAGRTELLQTIFGLHPKNSSGTVLIDGRPVAIRSPEAAIRAGLALAPEDRKVDGLVLSMSVAANTTLACLPRTERFGLVQAQLERELVGEYVERLGVKTPSISQTTRNLSGGNQQKVVLSKWLATSPKILMLDEPTRGIDINAKREIYALIDELAHTGLAIVMVSSELPEILAVADRIMVMAEGRKTAEFNREEATEERLLHAALPVGTT